MPRSRTKWKISCHFNYVTFINELDIPNAEKEDLHETFRGLTSNPYPGDSKSMRRVKNVRIVRSGSYRVLYRVNKYHARVVIIKIGHRGTVYDGIVYRDLMFWTTPNVVGRVVRNEFDGCDI